MSSPRLRFSRPRALTDGQRARRIVLAALVLTNPVTAAIAAALIIIGRAARAWVRAPWILAAGIAATAWGVWADQAPAYFHAYRDLASRFIDALAHAGDTAAVLRDNWQDWVAMQAPFAACAATLAAGIYLTYRRRFDATWRDRTGDGEGDRARRPRKPPSRRAIERAKARQRSRAARAKTTPDVDGLTIPVGVDAARARPVSIDAAALRTHGVVIGPTGVGKTQALERLVHGFTAAPAARALRLPAVVIDMKADPGLAATLRALADSTGRAFHHVTATTASPDAYNPLAGLTADEAADALYETLFASDTSANMHYATLSRRLLQQATRVLDDLDAHGVRKPGGGAWRVCLADVTALLSIDELRKAAPYVGPGAAQSLMRYLDDIDASKSAAADVGDVRDRMAVIADTAAGRVLDASGFRLEDAIRAGDITVFSLDAAGSPATARTIGTLAVQDLSATFGRLARDGWGQDHVCLTVLDEFSALASPKVADLYARARSAGGAVLLATQDLDADLESVSPQFAAAVRTNANVWIVLRQTRGEAADAIARDIGSRLAWKETLQVEDDWDVLGGLHAASGVGSLREVDEFILHPNDIKSLPQGGAYLVIKIPTGSINRPDADTVIERVHINALTPDEPRPPTTGAGRPAPAATAAHDAPSSAPRPATPASAASAPTPADPDPGDWPTGPDGDPGPGDWPDAPDWDD